MTEESKICYHLLSCIVHDKKRLVILLGNKEEIDGNVFPLISIRSEDRLQLIK